jgi:hypothetical protein
VERKLTCINKKGWYRLVPFGRYDRKEPVDGPKFFDPVTVVGEKKVAGQLYYDLAEWPGGGPYEARGFIVLDDLSQTVIGINEELETLSVM